MSKKQKKSGRGLGKRGESAAARYLELTGLEVLDRNWKCPAGEADIVARDGDEVVFVTVSVRTGIERGFPDDRVTPEVRSRNEKIAAYYLSDFDEVDIPVRFDAVALLVIGEDRAMIRHYKNVFGHGC